MKYLSKAPQLTEPGNKKGKAYSKGEIHLTKLSREEYKLYHNILVTSKRFLEKKQYKDALISEFVEELTNEINNFCKFFERLENKECR